MTGTLLPKQTSAATTTTRAIDFATAQYALRQRFLDALEAIVRHGDMPAGESWERAYNEVVGIAREAIDEDALAAFHRENEAA